jgi:hypothetical protein
MRCERQVLAAAWQQLACCARALLALVRNSGRRRPSVIAAAAAEGRKAAGPQRAGVARLQQGWGRGWACGPLAARTASCQINASSDTQGGGETLASLESPALTSNHEALALELAHLLCMMVCSV